ncbi:vWA domain-containing protein [Patulibacter sp. S7RM1-6]
MDAAPHGLGQLVDRLDAQDRLGVVAFDHDVRVVVPCAPPGDGLAARYALRRVIAGGSTNLSAGLLRGLEQARDAKGEGGATLLLLSDGHANDGVRDPERLGQLARGARTDGVTVGVIGIGLGYDEEVLGALAAGGAGDVHFAEQADATIGALTAEVDGLLDQVVQAASLTVTPSSAVRSVRLYNDLPVSETDTGFTVELGDFTAGETRRRLLRADVPALADLGLEAVCALRLRWTELATMTTRTLDLPVHVNVVPGDPTAGRVPDPKVRTEFAYQQAQKARKAATTCWTTPPTTCRPRRPRHPPFCSTTCAARWPSCSWPRARHHGGSGAHHEAERCGLQRQDAQAAVGRGAGSASAAGRGRRRRRGRLRGMNDVGSEGSAIAHEPSAVATLARTLRMDTASAPTVARFLDLAARAGLHHHGYDRCAARPEATEAFFPDETVASFVGDDERFVVVETDLGARTGA